MSNVAAQIPTSFGHELRACLRCKLVKTYDQFRESGCENCPFFNMEKDHETVGDCTTSNFTGIISVMDPSRSWSARWLRIARFVPGCYALAVSEELTEDLQAICEENRVQYKFSELVIGSQVTTTLNLDVKVAAVHNEQGLYTWEGDMGIL